ncbi:hypothetical protein PAMP_020470 [Pampus punctatissimus]
MERDSGAVNETVCSPSVAHECHNNTYLNSVCYNTTDQLELISSFESGFQECTEKLVNLVFLFDGSASMTIAEFNNNKDFIMNITNTLKNSSIKFAAAQFSTTTRTVFDFNDYDNGTHYEKLLKEPHMKALTNTHGALTFVLEEIFENPKAGASPDATKVLILITDGDPSDKDIKNINLTYEEKNIKRFVIGIKVENLVKLEPIASKPMDKYAFKIENYDGLTQLLESLQKRILKTEGIKVAQAGDITNEMSQSGFSAVFYKIGSYFGAELCSVDVDSDGNTDFLLVGAPMFYHSQGKREGNIYIYTLTDTMQLKSELNVTAPSTGRFGSSISSLADLNGDGLRDIAVGAPLEDEHRGAVYIYLGDRHRGIRSTFSQRITGQEIKPELRFFGQAIDGNIDLGDDRLPDIVVGSCGAVIVFRSKAVFNVMAHLSFQPEEINTDQIDCLVKTDKDLPLVTLTVCFEMVETTKSKAGAIKSGLNISYMLDVDPTRQIYRGFFKQSGRKSRNLFSTYILTDKETCFNYSIYMPKCVKDTLSPINIRLNFSQVDSVGASALLNMDSKRQAVVEIPFKKECRKNDTCIAELEVDFNFTTPTLLVAEDGVFNVSIKLSNHGDDSYNTSLTMLYPPGLSFSMMTLKEATRPTLHSCGDLEGVHDKTVCGVSLPVYRSRSSATFQTLFRIIYDLTKYEWNDTISMTVYGKSDNANLTKAPLTKTLPVQFEIKMTATTKEDNINYLNFTIEDTKPKNLVTTYKVDNHGLKAFPVIVSLLVPTKLEHNFEMKNYQVSVLPNKTQCTRVSDASSAYCSQEKYCKIIVCDSFILDKESTTEFRLSGEVQFRDLKQLAANVTFLNRYTGSNAQVKFKSFLNVSYDNQRYLLVSNKNTQENQVLVELIILPDKQLIILTGVGIGFLLLIIIVIIAFKLGFFKRKKFEYDQHQDCADTVSISAQNNGTASESETDDKSDQNAEKKELLDKVEADDNTPMDNIEQD